jgi:hypothetical protein
MYALNHTVISGFQIAVFKPSRCNTNAREIKFLSIRKSNFRVRRDEVPICDKFWIPLNGDWYRSKEDMVTNETNPFTCGTEMGIWLNGR